MLEKGDQDGKGGQGGQGSQGGTGGWVQGCGTYPGILLPTPGLVGRT